MAFPAGSREPSFPGSLGALLRSHPASAEALLLLRADLLTHLLPEAQEKELFFTKSAAGGRVDSSPGPGPWAPPLR